MILRLENRVFCVKQRRDARGNAAKNGKILGTTPLRVATTNGYTNWTSTLQLAAGTNVLKACAINLGGNYSPTNTVNIISTNAFKMQFGLVSRSQTANGFGFSLDVSPGVNGRIEDSTNLIDWTVLTKLYRPFVFGDFP
ncbi:MAG TPA: hypothetical protein VMF08_16545 [Candidatus Sulfotelmatobacter sp.]|nr:hypothetical protein [Candidatus Sulfotelmatobacter sp.]